MEGNSTQIDELRLDITVEDKTSGDSSDKRVRKLATAISRLNENLKAFDNAKFSKTFENMAKGIEPFVKKIDSVSSALESLATIVKKSGLEKAVEQATSGLPASEKKGVDTGSGGGKEPIQASGGQAQQLSVFEILQQAEYEQKLKEVENATKEFFDTLLTKEQKTKNKLAELNTELYSLKTKFGLLKSEYASALMQGDSVEEIKSKAKETFKEIKKVQREINNLTSGNAFSSLFKQFSRVGLYRIIRTVIKFITDSLKEGAEEIAQISPEFNETWSSVLTSVDKIKGSLATIGANILPIIEPIIRVIADLFTTISNTVGRIVATLNGTGKAIQTNTKYQKDYNKELKKGSLLSFDTFTTLSVDDSQNELFDQIESGTLGSGITGILDSLTPIFDFINELIELITDVLIPVIAPIMDIIGGIADQMKGAFKIISGLLKILTGDFSGAWDLIGSGFTDMVNGIANMFIALFKFIIDALNLLFVKSNPLFWVLKAFGIDVGEKISNWNANWSSQAWNPIKSYSTGGAFNSADVFYANENGKTELITSNNSGGGAVMTEEMWGRISEMSVYNALVKYGASQNGGIRAYIGDIDALGTATARSTGFKNETKRQGQRQYFN